MVNERQSYHICSCSAWPPRQRILARAHQRLSNDMIKGSCRFDAARLLSGPSGCPDVAHLGRSSTRIVSPLRVETVEKRVRGGGRDAVFRRREGRDTG